VSLTPPKNLSAVLLTPVNNFSAVSLTPTINFSLFGYFWLVSTTPWINVIAGVNDTADKLFTGVNDTGDKLFASVNDTADKVFHRRPPKLATAAEGGHGRQNCHWNSHEKAQEHLTHSDHRPQRPPKLLQTKAALFIFGGPRGLWSRCVGCLWMQLFMAVPMTPSAAVANFGGRRYRRFIPFNYLLPLEAPHLHSALVLVTGNNLLPVSLSPVIIVHRCRCHQW
jgi:hypothetical protein